MQNEREQAFLWQGGVNRATVNFVGGEGERVGQADVKSARFSRKSVLSSADPQPVTGTAFTCVLASAWGPWRRDGLKFGKRWAIVNAWSLPLLFYTDKICG